MRSRIVDFLRNHTLMGGTILVSTFFVVIWALPNAHVIEFLRMLQASIAVAVIIAYAPWAWRAAKAARPDRVDQLTLGISLGFFALLGQGLWLLVWRIGGKPPWMLDSALAAFWIWLSILAGVLHITAPGAIDGVIPRRNLLWLGVTCGCGTLLALLLAWSQPDLGPIVRSIESWAQETP